MIKSKLLTLAGVLSVTMLLMTGCSITIDGKDLEVGVSDVRETASDKLTIDNVTAVNAKITDNVGSVSIEYSDTTNVEIDIEYKATGMHKSELEEILEVVAVDAKADADILQVGIINKDSREDIWEWIEDEYGVNRPNLSVELDIKLPKSIQNFEIRCNVGNVDLDSLTGEFDIKTDVGSVRADSIRFTKDSQITVDVGDIDCTLNTELTDKVKVELTTNVGSIKLDTEDMEYTSENTGGDDFVGTSESILVNNLCEIEVQIDVGKLSLR